MNESKVVLQSIYLFFVFFCNFTSGAQRKCAEYNEYCQEHWECCSNTCLTYSYRCIGKKAPIGSINRPTLTLEELLETIAEVNTIPPITHNQPKNSHIEISKKAVRTLLDANNDEAGVALSEPIQEDRFGGVEAESDIAVDSKEPALIFFVLQPQEMLRKSKQSIKQTQAAEDMTTDEASIVKAVDKEEEMVGGKEIEQLTAIQCKEIGEKCYRHEDCCTQRCHGFLHQCVT